MEQYIPKSALVAEIKARISDIEVSQKVGLIKKRDANKKIFLFKSVLSLIDTLEVKEINLEKAIDNYIYTNNGRQRMALELDWKQCNITFNSGKLIDFAKHFFKLGMQVSNKAQKGEEV